MKSKMKLFGAKLARSPCSLVLAALGILFIVFGLLLYLFLSHELIHKVIAKKIAITEGSETFQKWKAIPMPIYYRYYFFNVSNAADVERVGAKPIVAEYGPFTYESRWTKTPITFNGNGTVTFRERKVLHFVRSLSVASDTERLLTTINGPLTVTLALLQKAPLVVRNIVSLGLSTVAEGFFVRRSARELLYDGYPEMLTSFGPLLNPQLPNTRGRFAWMYGRNNTDDGLYTVYTGEGGDLRRINRIDRFNGRPELNYWRNDSDCNRLEGVATDGQIISATVESGGESGDEETSKSFVLFHPELCRKIRFITDPHFNSSAHSFQHRSLNSQTNSNKPESSTSESQSSTTLPFPFDRYIPDPDSFSSSDDHPPNSCYLSKITPSRPELGDLFLSIRQQSSSANAQNQANAPRKWPVKPFSYTRGSRLHFKSGVFDLSTCKYGAPVLLSWPHFLHAHASYRENLVGMRPDPVRHQFSLMVEPKTGTPLATSARIQINLYISKPPWISRFRYVPEIVFPVFWQEMSAQVPAEVAQHLAWALTTPFSVADTASLVIIVLGLVLVARSACIVMRLGGPPEQRAKSGGGGGGSLAKTGNGSSSDDIQLHVAAAAASKMGEKQITNNGSPVSALSASQLGFVNQGLVKDDEGDGGDGVDNKSKSVERHQKPMENGQSVLK